MNKFFLIGVIVFASLAGALRVLGAPDDGRQIYGYFVQDVEVPTFYHWFVPECEYQFSGLDFSGSWKMSMSGGTGNVPTIVGTGLASFCEVLEEPEGGTTFGVSSAGDGLLYFGFQSPSGNQLAFSVSSWNSGVYETESFNYSTRIISTTPVNEAIVATSTTFTIGATGYLNENDYSSDYAGSSEVYLEQKLSNNAHVSCQLVGVGFVDSCGASQADLVFDYDVPLDGLWSFSTTTEVLSAGKYTLDTKLMKSRWYWWDQELAATSTWFIAATSTWFDSLQGEVQDAVSRFGGPASSTARIGTFCSPWSVEFSITDCSLAMIIPSSAELSGWAASVKTLILPRFPIGYVADFVSIVSSTSTQPLVALHAVVPPTLPGAGSELTLSLDHVLDLGLNATSGPFLSGEATSTATFYEITSYYWEIVVYVLVALYILRRILGAHLIPHFKKHDI